MKNWLKVLFAVMLVVTCAIACVSCNNNSSNSGNNNGGNNSGTIGGNNGGSTGDQDTVNPPEKPPVTDFVENAYQIKFHYSYTAMVVNENDRTEYKQADVEVDTIYVPYDEADEGWTEALLAQKDELSWNGYKFDAWYPAWDENSGTGWNYNVKPQVPVGDPYDFSSPITGDIHLYAYKGDRAGDNINWDVTLEYATDASEIATVPENSVKVELVNVSWCDEITKNAVKTVKLGAFAVDKTTGWTKALTDDKDLITYDGYTLIWYSAWDYTTMTPVGETYNFDTAPTEDMTLYCMLGAHDDDAEDTEVTLVSGVLNLVGSGAMFDFKDANSIDIPWYDYIENITEVVIGDGITHIGKNSFSNFSSLKSIDFGADVTVIGENAFYECDNSAFRTLRLPATVTTISKYAFAKTRLAEVIFAEGLKFIGEYAFSGSYEIKSIVVPESLETVQTAAFYSGSKGKEHNLSKIYYLGANAQDFKNKKAKSNEGSESAKGFISTDNESFVDHASVYAYVDIKNSAEKDTFGLYWYYYNVDDVLYPAQYCYALKYYVGASKTPVFVDYVPVSPKEIDVEVQKVDENGEPVFDANGAPVMEIVKETVFDTATGVPVFEGLLLQSNVDNVNKLMKAEKLVDENQNTICDLGYGFVEITLSKQPVDFTTELLINGDKSYTCERAKYASSGGVHNGILGGGIIWSLDDSTGTLTVKKSENLDDSNVMWDFYTSSDAQSLWYGNGIKVPNIKTIIIEDGIKNIGEFVFSGTGIKEIFIPESVNTISKNAFVNCSSLLSIYYMGETLPEGSSELNIASANLYAKTTTAIDTDGSYWMQNANNDILAWSLNNGELFVGGDDEMLDFGKASDAPWYGAKDSITSVKVASNIVSLSKYFVSGYTNVTKISLPAVLKKIPQSAFENTAIVNQMSKYEKGMLVIDGHLIKVDPARRNTPEFVITATVYGYVNGSIRDNGELIRSSIINIADGAFSRCDKIENLVVANTVKYINAEALKGTNLKKIFVDNSKESWAVTAADVDCGRISTYYKGDYRVNTETGEYTPKNGVCNHVFDDDGWKIVTNATCLEKGLKERSCIFEDCDFKETLEIPQDPNGHTLVEAVIDATCESNKLNIKKCTNCVENKDGVEIKCDFYEKVSEVEGTQLSHEYGEVVDDLYLVPGSESNPTYYKSCVNGCGERHESETFKPAATDPEEVPAA